MATHSVSIARETSGVDSPKLRIARAQVTQSVVSAYESAKREPSVEMLGKLVGAAGFDLAITLVPSPRRSERRAAVDRNRRALVQFLRSLGVSNVRLFGSVARGHDGPDSDIDLLVDVQPDVGMFTLGKMCTEAERILGSRVDIVPASGLKPDAVYRAFAEAIQL